MFFNSIKETNRWRKEINRLSNKVINRWRWEINSLLTKGMSNIYLKATNWRSQLRFSKFKNFKISCCNLKIRRVGAKLCVAFLLFWFWKELWRFKVKESTHFVEQKYKL